MMKRRKQKATENEEQVFVCLSVRIFVPGSMVDQVDVSLMSLKLLAMEKGRLMIWLLCLQRPGKVGEVEDVESA